jgi:uncharacterized repeat protein (TIGR01451 family)
MRPSPIRFVRVALLLLFAALASVGLSRAGTIDTWTPMGPAPGCCFFPGGETGRATAIAVDPNNADDVWLGTAGGGVWHSSDGAKSWTPMSDQEASLAIGSIALANCDSSPTGTCHTILAGTGENAIRRDTYYGAGLLVGSFDGLVIQWTLRHGQAPPPPAPTYDFTHGSIYNVVLDPTSGGQTVYITLSSGVTASASESTDTAPEPLPGGYGIYKSVDGGASWNRLTIPGTTNKFLRARPTDLEMSPANPSVLYAGFLRVGVFQSNDAGATWCPLNPGIPKPTGCPTAYGLPDPTQGAFDHVEIATDSTSATHLYATFGLCSDPLVEDCAPSVYETKDGGAHWTQQYSGNSSPSYFDGIPDCPKGYSRYTHALTVVPGSPEKLYLGEIHLCVSTDHGATWNTGDRHDPGCINQPSCVSHYDHHAVVRAPSDPTRLYDANDGGIVYSTNGGGEWRTGNTGLATMEFQSVATSPWNKHAIGGLQDNAAAEWTPGSKLWNHLDCCGDGGFAVMENDFTGYPAPKDDMYVTSNVGALAFSKTLPDRSFDGGVTWGWPPDNYNVGINDLSPRSFYPPLIETTTSYLYFGTQSLFSSTDSCGTWSAISPVLSTEPEPEIAGGQDAISAIGVAPTSQFHVYVGFYSGKIFETAAPCSGPGCWHLGAQLPGPVTWIAVDPTDENNAYATISGFTKGSHVYQTQPTDPPGSVPHPWSATKWIPELEKVPANTIAINPSNPADLWLGTDHGVYRSKSAGGAWARYSDGLPNVPVYKIIVEGPPYSRIIAATHGRGAWILTSVLTQSYVDGPIDKLVLDQPVFGEGFLPRQGCSMKILRQDGTVCASGATDAVGGSLTTDAGGFLVSNKAGLFTDMPLVWACKEGRCLGGSAGACNATGNPMTMLETTCGAKIATQAIADSSATDLGPISATLTLGALQGGVFSPGLAADPGGEAEQELQASPNLDLPGGAFALLPAVQSGDGTTRLLCRVNVTLASGGTAASVLQSARDAVNGDSVCRTNGVSAAFQSGDRGPWNEDLGPSLDRLTLQAPDLTGGKLIPAVSAPPGAATGLCFSASGLDTSGTSLIRAMKVRFSTPPSGAQGGSLTLSERSRLGQCTITVPIAAGAQPSDIAGVVAAAFQTSGIPGPYPDCPSSVNPRDVTNRRDAVMTSFASDLTICSNDAGIGVAEAPVAICFAAADCDDGNPCTADSCDPTTGLCQSTPVPDGQTCDDGNPCTAGNTCHAGACGTPVVCGGGSVCAPNVCDPATGACVSQPKVCDDGNPCTQDACSPASGLCTFTPMSGTACNDGDPCTTNDVCVVIPGTGVPICQGVAACDDGNDCTADHCDAATGACTSLPIQCDDGNACTADMCVGGTCVTTPLPVGTVCGGGDLCSTGGTCGTDPFTGAPTCTTSPVNCDDGDACTADSCDPTNGTCIHTPLDLAEVPTGLQFTSQASFNWPGAGGAVFYNTYRGTIPQHMMGSRPPAGPLYDQACFEYGDAHNDGAMVSNDTAVPPVGTGFYYLVSEETSCGESSIGSDSNNTPIPNASACSNPAPPSLHLVKSHSGDFTQGQTGATYTVIVFNSGSGPTIGTVTVTDVVPSGLTLVSMAGPGWNCPASPGNTCSRGDTLAGGGASYPPITVTVNVAGTASSPQVNQAGVSGGGSTSAFSNDSTTIIPLAPALSITKTHTGHFYLGQPDATYTLTVSNTGNAPTSGTVNVTDAPPTGIAVTSMSGTGWTCSAVGCARNDALAAGASYPVITVAVSVTNPNSPSEVNQATVVGGGSPSATANDTTLIDFPLIAMLKSHTGNFYQGQTNAIYRLSVQNQGFGQSFGTVTVTEVIPAGLTLVSMAGTGWSCPASPGNVCTRSDVLASTAFYPDLTVTVNVASNAPSSIMNHATISGGGSNGTGNAFDPTTIDPAAPVLSITKTHTGNFTQGQQGATYTVTVSNTGNAPTSGTITVTETVPSGLTLVSMAGTGWTCPSPGNTCSRSDALAAGASYPDITVTVNVSATATSPQVNQVSASQPGVPPANTSDSTNIDPGIPVLSATKTHNGNFSQGQTNATYKVTVTNTGPVPTFGPVNVDEMAPPGLTFVSMSGTGWNCPPGVPHCDRNDPLPPGTSYPVITVTVNVRPTAPSPQVNQVNVSGGGAPPVMASDSTTIIAAGVPSLTITKTHVGNFTQGQIGATYTLTISNNIGAGTTTSSVAVQELPPPGLTPVSMSGTGWTCSPTSCNRTTTLAPGASYPPITVTVNVAATATSPVVNQARVLGGGSAPSTTTDPTVIVPAG